MILDTSAAVAIVCGEPGFEAFARAIDDAPSCTISAATFVEASIVSEARAGASGLQQLDSIIRSAKISIEPVTSEQAHIAREAYSTFGKGRHPANLNFGDCFSYALAKTTGEPLLFKGDDFRKTDIAPAL